MSTVPNLPQLHHNAGLCLETLLLTVECCKLYIHTDFCLLYWMLSKLLRLLDTASKLALFLVSGLKDEKLIKIKQTYMKTETCKLYSRVFWIFLPNIIKIDPYNFELYRFKVGAFFETQCSLHYRNVCNCSPTTTRETWVRMSFSLCVSVMHYSSKAT